MGYEDEILDFLIKPENMKFILEITPFIEKAKERKLSIFSEQMVKKIVASMPDGWKKDGFYFTRSNESIKLIDPDYDEEKYLQYQIYIGTSDRIGFYYGLVGTCKKENDELKSLIQLLKRLECDASYYSWYRYKYFSITYADIYTLGETEVQETIDSLMEEFWDFADTTYDAFDSYNDTVG